jgi:hypothetical protein
VQADKGNSTDNLYVKLNVWWWIDQRATDADRVVSLLWKAESEEGKKKEEDREKVNQEERKRGRKI